MHRLYPIDVQTAFHASPIAITRIRGPNHKYSTGNRATSKHIIVRTTFSQETGKYFYYKSVRTALHALRAESLLITLFAAMRLMTISKGPELFVMCLVLNFTHLFNIPQVRRGEYQCAGKHRGISFLQPTI